MFAIFVSLLLDPHVAATLSEPRVPALPPVAIVELEVAAPDRGWLD
ncbi:MAG: hypothetical protein ACU0CI_07550 [Shimia sp.]